MNTKTKSKSGFTLAEVLITLGIIGVVAAMTIPTLIERYKEQELVTRWFKFYSLLQQAIKLAEEEYGDHTTWKFENYHNGDYRNQEPDETGTAYGYLKPFLKIANDCPVGGKNCFLTGSDYTFLDNKGKTQICSYYGPAVKLLSGETICFSGGSPHFIVDLNGNAPPNKFGVDVQYFSFIDLPESRFYPGFNWGWVASADNAEYCNTESSTWHNGASCGFWIQRYKNMDYLRMSKAEVKTNWKPKRK